MNQKLEKQKQEMNDKFEKEKEEMNDKFEKDKEEMNKKFEKEKAEMNEKFETEKRAEYQRGFEAGENMVLSAREKAAASNRHVHGQEFNEEYRLRKGWF